MAGTCLSFVPPSWLLQGTRPIHLAHLFGEVPFRASPPLFLIKTFRSKPQSCHHPNAHLSLIHQLETFVVRYFLLPCWPRLPFISPFLPLLLALPIIQSLSLGESRSLPLQQDKTGWEVSLGDCAQSTKFTILKLSGKPWLVYESTTQWEGEVRLYGSLGIT